MSPRAPTYYDVPAGTPATPCTGRGCSATIYFITSPKSGKPLPVDCDADDLCHRPTATAIGGGVSHFTTCSAVAQFSGRNRGN